MDIAKELFLSLPQRTGVPPQSTGLSVQKSQPLFHCHIGNGTPKDLDRPLEASLNL